MGRDAYLLLSLWSPKGEYITGKTSVDGKALSGYRALVMKSNFVGVLEIGWPLIWVKE